MKKHYYLGFNAKNKNAMGYLFMRGADEDYSELEEYLSRRYKGEAVLCKNGRSALALALIAYFNKGDRIIVNGFTCFAVYEAVKAAGLIPVFADISKDDLNFNIETLNTLWKEQGEDSKKAPISGIIVQNSLGNPVDIEKIERFAGKHGLIIIEDLAHSVGIKYPDGREAGTVGAAAVLSFGKEKAVDTVSGGAVVMRYPCNLIEETDSKDKPKPKIPGKREVVVPSVKPRKADSIRERLYPVFASWNRGLTHVHLNGVLMKILLKLHLVQKSADNKLDLERLLTKFEAKSALWQLKSIKNDGVAPLRNFYLVKDRESVLKELQEAGYYFDGFWYEKPVAPERYYSKVHFDEKRCPVATEVAKQIINFPTYYEKSDLAPAKDIIDKYLIKGDKND